MKTRHLFIAAACAAAAILTGCALRGPYMLGSTLPPHLKTINIATFKNKTEEPTIESRITSAVRREFQRDGQLKIDDNADTADITLEATLLAYDVDPLLYDRNDNKTTRRYKAKISCHLIAKERKTGKIIVVQNVTGETTFPAMGDTVTAKRNALNDVARNLAKEVVDAVVGAW